MRRPLTRVRLGLRERDWLGSDRLPVVLLEQALRREMPDRVAMLDRLQALWRRGVGE